MPIGITRTGETMFLVECERCGPSLVGTRMIRSFKPTPLGIELVVRCHCGDDIHHLTGRRTGDTARAAVRPGTPARSKG